MKILRKIAYLLLALSLLPILATYFGYGNTLDLIYFGITLMVFIGLLYLLFTTSSKVATWVFWIGIILFFVQLVHLKDFWLNNEGGDPRVTWVFTFQAAFINFVLWLLFKESTMARNKK